jgi:hypothetical protein
MIAWRELRNRWFADSALEETEFELLVPPTTETLFRRPYPDVLGLRTV